MNYHIEMCDVFSAIIPCLTIGVATIMCMIEGNRFLKPRGYNKKSRVAIVVSIFLLGVVFCFSNAQKEFHRRVYEIGLQYVQSGDYLSAHDTFEQIYTGYAEAARALESIQQEVGGGEI